jgi:predicted metal-dependent peptidase
MKDYIDSLFEIVEPVIDWKSYLRRFNSMSTMVYTKKTRRKPNRRFNTGPALKIKQKKRTLVAIDTSGSVSNDDLVEFFNEIYHIYKSGTYVDIIECDAKVQRVYEYKGQREEIQVQGRGGTDFEPVMQYLSEHRNEYANLIYLTDGECCAPKTQPKKPMLWVHSSGHQINDLLPGAKVKIVR